MQLTPGLSRFVDAPIVYRPRRIPAEARAVIGWGLKGNSLKALAYAQKHGLPYVALEDGFLRSVSLGDKDPPQSVVVDDVGVYYNAHVPSRLEALVAASHDSAAVQRARDLAKQWRDARVSKYNYARERRQLFLEPYVLVIDQTVGDASIAYGLANEHSFGRMLDAALDENPTLPVILKVHPDVIAGRKRAHFGQLTPGQAARVRFLASDVHPPAVLAGATSVYVVTSQMGFEALLWDKPVRSFGMPFYAGWGLTSDELPPPVRRRTVNRVSLEDLVHAALIEYPRYVDPETLDRCEVERVVAWMALQRRRRERFPAQVQAMAFSDWKKPVACSFFAGSTMHFVEVQQALRVSADRPTPLGDAAAALAVWGRPTEATSVLRATGTPLLCVEDGFLRSVGLGADWVRPLSWVIDSSGMYYDATAPSDLETLLQTHRFDDALLARSRALRKTIVAAGVTKYNVGSGTWVRPPGASRVLLVPGQVESDASITYGAPGLRSNLALLQAVRQAEPDAYVIYKPHPDVLAKKRLRGANEEQAGAYCDEVVSGVAIHRLLDAVDEVHVLTSLAGFEALLRGKRVVCHGQPFYAGWGLTEDVHFHPRRTRRLALDELVAAALILYPTYVSRTTNAFTTPERALHELSHWDEVLPPREARWLSALRWLKRIRDRWRRQRR